MFLDELHISGYDAPCFGQLYFVGLSIAVLSLQTLYTNLPIQCSGGAMITYTLHSSFCSNF